MDSTIVKEESLSTSTLQTVLEHARATGCTVIGSDGIEECTVNIWVEKGSYDYLFNDPQK
jgi:hypothetical protein